MASMARAVVGAVMSIFMGTFLLWFMLPLLLTTYNQLTKYLDRTDPEIDRVMDMGDMLFNALGITVFGVTGYLVFAYATERRPFDTGE